MSSNLNLYVSTYQGLESVLNDELIQNDIGTKHEIKKRGVALKGSLEDIYKINYTTRTALRMLINLDTFILNTKEDLYHHGKNIEWEKWFTSQKTIAVDAVVRSPLFSNSVYAAQLLKDAICDRFNNIGTERPSVDLKQADIRIHLLIAGDSCTISLDSSGSSLHKRGYKTTNGKAPLSEVLAAGIIALSGWDKSTHLHDGMCGSGTILSEAALITLNKPCGFYRKNFCFKHWKNFDKNLWSSVQSNCDRNEQKNIAEISGSDHHSLAVEDTALNLASAQLNNYINVRKKDFFHATAPSEKGLLIINPPYDKRIALADAKQFYAQIGDKLKADYKGWQAAVFSANIPAIKSLGLKPKRRIPLWNGPFEGRLMLYDLY